MQGLLNFFRRCIDAIKRFVHNPERAANPSQAVTTLSAIAPDAIEVEMLAPAVAAKVSEATGSSQDLPEFGPVAPRQESPAAEESRTDLPRATLAGQINFAAAGTGLLDLADSRLAPNAAIAAPWTNALETATADAAVQEAPQKARRYSIPFPEGDDHSSTDSSSRSSVADETAPNLVASIQAPVLQAAPAPSQEPVLQAAPASSQEPVLQAVPASSQAPVLQAAPAPLAQTNKVDELTPIEFALWQSLAKNTWVEMGVRTIHYAAQHNDVKALQMLCEKAGRNPNMGTEQRPDFIYLSLLNPMSYNVICDGQTVGVAYGVTPLMYAAAGNCHKALDYLLSRPEIEIDLKDSTGLTARDYAVINRHDAIVAKLDGYANALRIRANNVSPGCSYNTASTLGSASLLSQTVSSSLTTGVAL
ncbi:MAG: hypothetical protein K0S29_1166 [Gammaproteobacteria bacterium]|jgi:hypothetical protein|nr:hypothetical protein [Gammaproteobacteria bacterium]